MSAVQQAAIVASAQDWAKAQRQGGDGSNQFKRADEQTAHHEHIAPDTTAKRAEQSGASVATQRRANAVGSYTSAMDSPDFAEDAKGQGLAWKDGDFMHNLTQMLQSSYNGAVGFAPAIKDIDYDFDSR